MTDANPEPMWPSLRVFTQIEGRAHRYSGPRQKPVVAVYLFVQDADTDTLSRLMDKKRAAPQTFGNRPVVNEKLDYYSPLYVHLADYKSRREESLNDIPIATHNSYRLLTTLKQFQRYVRLIQFLNASESLPIPFEHRDTTYRYWKWNWFVITESDRYKHEKIVHDGRGMID